MIKIIPINKGAGEEHSAHYKFKNFSLCKMYRHRQVLEWLGLQFCIFLVGETKVEYSTGNTFKLKSIVISDVQKLHVSSRTEGGQYLYFC